MITEQYKRIVAILGVEGIEEVEDLMNEDLYVSENTLRRYLKYLKEHIKYPCQVTGIEDFQWEEYYVWGPGDEKEYKRLKKTQPSYTDIFTLLGFEEKIYPDKGIIVKAQRVSDNKKFALPLADLETTDKKSINYELLDDYSVWFVNFI